MCLFPVVHQEVMYARACSVWLVSRSGTSWDGRSTIEEAPNPTCPATAKPQKTKAPAYIPPAPVGRAAFAGGVNT